MSDQLMPAAFIGHGTPMNAIDHNRFTDTWQAFAVSSPRPRAVLVISAHWFTESTAVTAMARPRTIHDFYGFPDKLSVVDYPAPGDIELAKDVARLASPTEVHLDEHEWGLDHGAWSVLVHMFPAAEVPVVQLSIDAHASFEDHFALAGRLAPLRASGVLIVASGNIVHNLHRMDAHQPDTGFDWAQRFDGAARQLMQESPEEFPTLRSHRDFSTAVPTPEHFIPAVYLAGLASTAGQRPAVLVDGYAMGSLSMTSYALPAVT